MALPVLYICIGIIAVTGTVANTLSLSYFIRKAKRTLTNRIFIFLNVFDLLVCIFDAAMVSFHYCGEPFCGKRKPLFRMFLALTEFSIESTAFATCLLSVTRTVLLCFPFYSICRKTVGMAGLVFCVLEVLRFLLRLYFYYLWDSAPAFYVNTLDNGIMIVFLSVVILINLVSCILSSWKLRNRRKNLRVAPVNDDKHAPRANAKQKATVTILLLSVLFCFFNTIYCITWYFTIFRRFVNLLNIVPVMMLYRVCFWLSIPLNSAINPIIYLIRKKDMRRYIKDIIPKVL